MVYYGRTGGRNYRYPTRQLIAGPSLRPSYSKRQAAVSGARRSTSAAAAVRRVSETKYTDVIFGGVSISTTPTFHDATDIQSGTSVTGRTANRIFVTHLECRLLFAAAASDGNNVIRMIFGRSRAGALTTADYPQNIYTHVDTDKIRILKDFTVCSQLNFQDTSATPDTDGVEKKFRYFKIPVNAYCKYDGSTSTTSLDGQIGIQAVSDSGLATHPTITGDVRIFFKDV